MQNFAELLVSPLEEIFVALIFASQIASAALAILQPICNFTVLIFVAADLSAKNTKFCTMREFPTIHYNRLSDGRVICVKINVVFRSIAEHWHTVDQEKH